jgi:ABC-type transporter Mla subunit MlaD
VKDLNNLDKNFNGNINELKNLLDELKKDLNTKLQSVNESEELLEVVESYKLKVENLSNSFGDEEE